MGGRASLGLGRPDLLLLGPRQVALGVVLGGGAMGWSASPSEIIDGAVRQYMERVGRL
jgi:hypothetical protein